MGKENKKLRQFNETPKTIQIQGKKKLEQNEVRIQRMDSCKRNGSLEQ